MDPTSAYLCSTWETLATKWIHTLPSQISQEDLKTGVHLFTKLALEVIEKEDCHSEDLSSDKDTLQPSGDEFSFIGENLDNLAGRVEIIAYRITTLEYLALNERKSLMDLIKQMRTFETFGKGLRCFGIDKVKFRIRRVLMNQKIWELQTLQSIFFGSICYAFSLRFKQPILCFPRGLLLDYKNRVL